MTNLEAAEAIHSATSRLYELTNDPHSGTAALWKELRTIDEAIEEIRKNEKAP